MEKPFDPTEQLVLKFGDIFIRQTTKDDMLTLWLPLERLKEILYYCKNDLRPTYKFLYDLTAIDERPRKKEPDYPSEHFTLVYHLYSYDGNQFIRFKILREAGPKSSPISTHIKSGLMTSRATSAAHF